MTLLKINQLLKALENDEESAQNLEESEDGEEILRVGLIGPVYNEREMEQLLKALENN